MEKRMSVSYDEEEDILSLLNTENVNESVQIGDIIIDLDTQFKIVGIEIFNATKFFKSANISKEFLSDIKEARLRVHYGNNWASMIIILHSGTTEQPIEKEVTIPIIETQKTAMPVTA